MAGFSNRHGAAVGMKQESGFSTVSPYGVRVFEPRAYFAHLNLYKIKTLNKEFYEFFLKTERIN